MEGDSKRFISLVNVVQRSFLDLSKANAQGEMSSTYMISRIEKLLPRNVQQDWTRIAQGLGDPNNLIDYFLDFLVNERNVQVHLESELLSNVQTGEASDLKSSLIELNNKEVCHMFRSPCIFLTCTLHRGTALLS